MDATVSVAIVTTIGTIIVAIITFFQNKNLKKENRDLSETKQKLETEIREIKDKLGNKACDTGKTCV